MLIFALLLACGNSGPECGNPIKIDPPECPCADAVWVLTEWRHIQCRPDQEMSLEWEPALTGSRVDDEKRVSGVVVCRCPDP